MGRARLTDVDRAPLVLAFARHLAGTTEANRRVFLGRGLKSDVQVAGTPTIDIHASLDKPQSELSAILVDYGPSTQITRANVSAALDAAATPPDRLPRRRPGGPMAEQLLQRVHAEIRARLRDAEPAVHEYARLKTALAALNGVAATDTHRGSTTAPASTPAARTSRRSSSRRHSTGTRAPRGANRAAVLRLLEERPGVSVAELASASGVARTALYTLLKTLEQRGEVARAQLPGGSTGYRLAPSAPAEPPAAASEPPAGDAA